MSFSTIALTLLFFSGLIAFDLRHSWKNRNRITTARIATKQISIYIAIAIIFGILMRFWTSESAQQAYFASWITEYSLSLDNLFVFIILFKKLRIPQEKQEIALFFGISMSLILRALCLIAGVALINRFVFINIIFALFLLYTSLHILRENGNETWEPGRVLRKLTDRGVSGFRLALYAIAITDLMFAFDSIPAVLGITTDIYVILTSNFMALMGLRQLYFMVERLTDRLYYLSAGISVILGFIAFKLAGSALIHYQITEILGFKVPEIQTSQSLLFIGGTIAISTILSLVRKTRP